MDENLLKIFDLARPFLDTRANEEHTRISFDYAVCLLREEGGDPEVVLPAIILHDVGWKSIPEELHLTAFGPFQKDADLNKVHEQEGARIAGEILAGVGYPQHLIEEITAIIAEHDSRKEPLSPNDAIVKDADKLWRYSAHGVLTNATRFGMTVPQYLDRLRSKMDEWLLTAAGKRLALEELLLRERTSDLGSVEGS